MKKVFIGNSLVFALNYDLATCCFPLMKILHATKAHFYNFVSHFTTKMAFPEYDYFQNPPEKLKIEL